MRNETGEVSRATTFGGVALFALVSLAVQLPIIDRGLVSIDEGHLVATAQRLLAGDLLYRDIHTGIFPGIYYATAALFEVFGTDLLVTRWAQFAVNTATVLLLWRIGLYAMRPIFAAFAPLVFLAAIPIAFPVLTMLNYSAVSGLFGIAALLFLLRTLERGRPSDALWLGVALAACALTKQNFGLLVGLAILGGFFWGRRDSPLRERTAFGGLAPVFLAGGVISLAAVAFFLATGTFGHLVDSTFTALLTTQSEGYANPIPPILGAHPAGDGRFLFLYMPAALFGYMIRGETILGFPVSAGVASAAIRLAYGLPLASLLAAPVVLWWTRASDSPARRSASRAIVLFALFFFLGIFPSAVWSHLVYVLAPALMVVGWVADRIDAALASRSQFGRTAFRGIVLGFAGCLALAALRIPADVQRWNPESLGIEGAEVFVGEDQAKLHRGATAFLERCSRPGEAVFVAPTHPILYVLAKRPNPTRYDLTIPGDVSGPEIISDLEASGTRCIVYDPKMYFEFDDFGDLFPELSRYLHTRFEKVAAIRGTGDNEWHGLRRRLRSTKTDNR
ncbi:MAG: glycosyltransferase family 39 protein [Myxococcota bacterium]